MVIPFEGVTPAPGRNHAAWVVEAMAGKAGVSLVVPEGFPAYARVHHPLHNGERWADFAPEFLRRGTEMYEYSDAIAFIDGDGNLGAANVDALVPLLTAGTTTPERCHYALWCGRGWTHQGSMVAWSPGQDSDGARRIEEEATAAWAPVSAFVEHCPVEPWWGGRDMLLFDGPIDGVSTIGWTFPGHADVNRQSPQWWWPEDRAWFVGTEIDHAWTYVAGAGTLIERILAAPSWEAVRIDPSTAGERDPGTYRVLTPAVALLHTE